MEEEEEEDYFVTILYKGSGPYDKWNKLIQKCSDEVDPKFNGAVNWAAYKVKEMKKKEEFQEHIFIIHTLPASLINFDDKDGGGVDEGDLNAILAL